jgi:hypothetical protein
MFHFSLQHTLGTYLFLQRMLDTYSTLYNVGWTHISLYNTCCIHICLDTRNLLDTRFYNVCRTHFSIIHTGHTYLYHICWTYVLFSI